MLKNFTFFVVVEEHDDGQAVETVGHKSGYKTWLFADKWILIENGDYICEKIVKQYLCMVTNAYC